MKRVIQPVGESQNLNSRANLDSELTPTAQRPAVVRSGDASVISRRDLPTILRGQLTIMRMRAEQGIAVSVECLARAEDLAWRIEGEPSE